jgi:predicted ATPase
LAEIFCSNIKNKSFIIETHSEHLIRGVQLAINKSNKKEGLNFIDYKDVDIIYISSEDGVINTKKMRINEAGVLLDKWPSGFFDQAYKFTMEMLG